MLGDDDGQIVTGKAVNPTTPNGWIAQRDPANRVHVRVIYDHQPTWFNCREGIVEKAMLRNEHLSFPENAPETHVAPIYTEMYNGDQPVVRNRSGPESAPRQNEHRESQPPAPAGKRKN